MMRGAMLIKASSRAVVRLVREAKKIEGITDAYPVFGRFDVVVFVEGKDFPELKRVAAKVNSLEGIKSTETLAEGD